MTNDQFITLVANGLSQITMAFRERGMKPPSAVIMASDHDAMCMRSIRPARMVSSGTRLEPNVATVINDVAFIQPFVAPPKVGPARKTVAPSRTRGWPLKINRSYRAALHYRIQAEQHTDPQMKAAANRWAELHEARVTPGYLGEISGPGFAVVQRRDGSIQIYMQPGVTADDIFLAMFNHIVGARP